MGFTLNYFLNLNFPYIKNVEHFTQVLINSLESNFTVELYCDIIVLND